jgi:hypothetical protein
MGTAQQIEIMCVICIIGGLPDVPRMEDLLSLIREREIYLMVSRISGKEKKVDHMIKNMERECNKGARSLKVLNMSSSDTSTMMKEITDGVKKTIEFDFM